MQDHKSPEEWKKELPDLPSNILDAQLEYANADVGGNLFSDKGVPGFLFLPLNLIRNGYQLSTDKIPDSKERLKRVNDLISADPVLQREVILSRVIAADIKAMLDTNFVETQQGTGDLHRTAAQAYIITGTGISSRDFRNLAR